MYELYKRLMRPRGPGYEAKLKQARIDGKARQERQLAQFLSDNPNATEAETQAWKDETLADMARQRAAIRAKIDQNEAVARDAYARIPKWFLFKRWLWKVLGLTGQ